MGTLKVVLFKVNPKFAADTLLTLFVGACKKEEMGHVYFAS